MILNLTVERQGLPPARIRWSTDSFTATHSAAAGSDPTIAQLVEQVNEVIPIENEIWGFEDYAVEVNGFECLHFARASKVLKDDDHLTIRPWQTQEVRFRSISGRQQISADGRHLIDGVSFGRPFLRKGLRPPIRIQPKRRARTDPEYDDEDEDEPAGYLMPGQANPSVEPEENVAGLGLFHHEPPQNGALTAGNMQGRSISQGGQPLKRRLEPAFEDAREGKRVRSALQPALSRSDRISSANGKSVRFQDRAAQSPSEATPSTIIAHFDSDSDDEDDDFDPGESSSPEPESGSDENKENFDPDTQQYSDPHPSSQPIASDRESDLQVHHTLSELPMARRSSLGSSSVSSSDLSPSVESSDEESSNLSESDHASSDDATSSSGSGGSESVSNEPAHQQSKHDAAAAATRPTASAPVPPGGGKIATKLRNQRRREQSKLNKLKAQGELHADTTLDGLRQWQAQNTKKHEFEANRQALLDALSAGGIDVTDRTEGGVSSIQKPPAVSDAPQKQTVRSTPQPAAQSTGQNVEEEQTEAPRDKRRKIDLGASKRMLLGGLGLRVPKNKAEEDTMREKSRQKAQKEAERHQRTSEADSPAVAEQPLIEEDWQKHVELKSVECADPSIHYSTPPFPFEQRWDPQQHYNNWRPKGRKKQKNGKRKRDEPEIEEHYDATMYDDQPQVHEQYHADEMAIDAEQSGMQKELPTPLDVSEKVDLLFEQALVGAKIAFKQLEMSEATGWQPKISDYKSAIVTSNDNDVLLLSLDGEYRVQKEVDPETGEIVGSRFIIADAQGEDDGLVEIAFTDLIEPKLLFAALTPNASQAQPMVEQIRELPVNAIDAIANSSEMTPGNGGLSVKTNMQSIDEGEETAVETSFNASTRTAVELDTGQQNSKSTSLNIDPAARDEASMLIREAGFRSAIDPEATKSLEGRNEPTNASHNAVDDQPDSPLFIPQDDEMEHENNESTESFDQYNSATQGSLSDLTSREPASDYIDLGVTPRASSMANGQATQDADYYRIPDSSQDMITEILSAAVDDSIREAARTPSSVIHTPGPRVDLARQIMTGGDASAEISVQEASPDAAPIEAEDVEEVVATNGIHEDDHDGEKITSWDALPINRTSSQPSAQTSSKRRNVRTTYSTKSGSQKTDRRTISMTQPEPSRDTRTTRRASAVANPITLSDDDEDADSDSDLPRTAPSSTAPVTGFTAINRPPPPASQPMNTTTTNRRHTTDMVDLTQINSDDPSDSDDSPDARVLSSFELKAAAFKERQRSGRKSENLSRTKSTI